MNVTINTDASYSHETKVGSYAFWVSSSIGVIKKSGVLKNCDDNNDAEMQCIGNALYSVLVNQNINRIATLYINTDSKSSIYHIERSLLEIEGKNLSKESISKFDTPKLAAYYLMLIIEKKQGERSFEFRHVKGHRHTRTARSWVNDWCDKESKKSRREFEKQLKS